MSTERKAMVAARALRRASEVLNYDFYLVEDPSWASEAGFTLLIVRMNDALQSMKACDNIVTFPDDIDPAGGNITDRVADMRNAACHLASGHHSVSERGGEVTFFVIVGMAVARVDGHDLRNPYKDDVAFYYGTKRIFLRRHLQRALAEATVRLRLEAHRHGWSLVSTLLDEIVVNPREQQESGEP